jgi:hypothetical protein
MSQTLSVWSEEAETACRPSEVAAAVLTDPLRQLAMVESDHRSSWRGALREVRFQIERQPRPHHDRQATLAHLVVLALVEIIQTTSFAASTSSISPSVSL